MNTLELLAPAANLETGMEAINCGADAVYIGAEKFGARAAAANSVEDIGKLAEYAHKYAAKVYVALNTILTDSEIPQALNIANNVWNAGADALIIQDMGLLEAGLPPIPLIASTQANCDTPEKAVFFEKCGFKRIILPREFSFSEIKSIRAVTKVELEFFVHGALCVSQSGQCYLSYVLGGRSANRGRCAQPCRKQYVCSDSNGEILPANKFPLCLKDLNLSKRLGALADAGITSFKIEGRLKDKAYVKNVVGFYRSELDKVIEKRKIAHASLGTPVMQFTPNTDKTFNRGFTQFFLDGNPSDVASPDTPKFKGEPLGTAFEVREGSFRIRDFAKLHSGDGICFFDKNNNLTGSLINGVKDGRVRADNLKGMDKGTAVYRNYDRLFIQAINNALSSRKFVISMEFSDYAGGYILKAVDERGVAAEVKLPMVKSRAKKPELALDTIRKQLSKLGDSEFILKDLKINMSDDYFLPVSALNDLRRDVLNKILKQNLEYVRQEIIIKKTKHKYPEQKLDYRANILNSYAKEFYKRHGVKDFDMAAEHGTIIDDKPLMRLRFCLRRQLGLCKKGKDTSPFFLEDEEGNKLRVEFKCDVCRNEVYLVRRAVNTEKQKNEHKSRA